MNPKRKTTIAIIVILIIISGLFFIGKSGFSILSGLRAYVGGEGLWAKSQKEASYQLVQYVFTGEADRYQSFVDYLRVPLGDKSARLKLEKPNSDIEIVIQGLSNGGNHQTDIPTMIYLYRYFKNMNYVQKAIQQWEVGDRLIDELLETGEQIKRRIADNSMDTEQTLQTLAAIDSLQKKLNEAENLFSYNMSAAARQTAYLFFVIMLVFTLAGGIICFVLLRSIAGIISDLKLNKVQLESQAEHERALKRELQDNEEKYRQLVDNANDAILIIQDKQVKFFNPAALKLTGYSTGELMDMPFMRFIYSKDVSTVVERYERRLKGEEVLSTYNCRFIKKQGETVWVQISAVKTMWEKKGATLTFCRDITQIRAAESKLQHTERMESIGNLAGGIAHDFNNILSSIIGFTELALEDVDTDSTIADNLQEVFVAGKRAKDLVHQILAFARQSDEERKPIQVDKIIKEVLQFIRSSIPTTIEIKHNIDSNSLIMGSETKVHQIMMNLFTNAAHTMEDEGGILNVSLKDIVIEKGFESEKLGLTYGNFIKISVADTGAGIAPDIIDSIFEPYFTTKNPGEGTGMGLAMAYGIVESYGGKITVDSTLGEGTTFTVYLPVTRKRKILQQYEPEQLPTGIERILFVDDEAPIAKMGSQGLKRLGYEVTIRTSSIEALELFRSRPDDFDLIITDMTMPNMTGDKLSIELMKIRADIPVILCTGYSKKISDETASDIGIKAFVYKPTVKADLAKTVRKVLDETKGSSQE